MAHHSHLHHHHQHVRKRVHQNLEKYPHPHKFKRCIDHLILFLSFAAPLATLPQVYVLFTEKTAEGVSLLSWSFYVFITIPWLFYGFLHKEKPIIIYNCLYLIINSTVVAGILLYS